MKKSILAVALLATLSASSFGQSKDIVDTAVAAGQFKTLVKAVQAAGLVNTLKGEGPFTVFAPTDAAFAKVPKPLLRKVLADKALLKKILLYHVVPGRILAKDVKTMAATTASGEKARIRVTGSSVMIDAAKVIKADVKATNGVIHVIDKVLLPPSVVKMLAKPRAAKMAKAVHH